MAHPLSTWWSVCVERECTYVISDHLECDNTECLPCSRITLVHFATALSMLLFPDEHLMKNTLAEKLEML